MATSADRIHEQRLSRDKEMRLDALQAASKLIDGPDGPVLEALYRVLRHYGGRFPDRVQHAYERFYSAKDQDDRKIIKDWIVKEIASLTPAQKVDGTNPTDKKDGNGAKQNNAQ